MPVHLYLPRELPEPLQELAGLAFDLRWSWNHGADPLWRAMDADLWEATHNPVLILQSVSGQRLEELAGDDRFLDVLRQQLDAREACYRSGTWFATACPETFAGHVAYFSMEFGLDESLPIYSGGLGVLAGDFMKTACDLGLPVIGVGLLYQQGYFRQSLDAHGEQLEFYPFNDPTMLPVVPMRDEQGGWVRVTVDLPGRPLRLRIWQVQVGRNRLLLLDSNDVLNEPGDRGITSELYGGGPELRLQQEIVLGIGGWRLLEQLGMDCPVCHLNEGHAAFAVLERARQHMLRHGTAFGTALHATRAGNLFTTHTPVAAGFDRFAPELFGLYFRDYAQSLGLPPEAVLQLGRAGTGNSVEPFNMAYLAVRGAAAVNGVSRLHGDVSRTIFQPLFPRWPRCEVPVGHVTNGVHVPSWDSAAADRLWTGACGKDRWRGALDAVERDLREIDDASLWRLRTEERMRLLQFLRERMARQHGGRGVSPERIRACAGRLDPDALTAGFARRFAEYKRTNLLLQDPQRLLRLLTDRDRPMQLVIAGKAHPRDAVGRRLLREWQEFIERHGVLGRVVFIEDYDLVVAAQLVQGVDLWINTPRRPWEASGTSGMKVLVNGGLNLSELDGWWAEAFTPGVGWALGDGLEHRDHDAWDRQEAGQLFDLLESEVVPCFYQRDASGVPREWVQRVRDSMARLTPQFSSNRMVREYVSDYYIPLSRNFRRRMTEAEDVQAWYRQLQDHWPRIHFGNVEVLENGDGGHFAVQVYLDDLPPEAVRVELYADPADAAGGGGRPERHALQRGDPLTGAANAWLYHGATPPGRPVGDYTPRIVPLHDGIAVPLEAAFITWYR